MPAQCDEEVLKFHPLDKREVRGGFDSGAITSDAGGLLRREGEKRTGIIRQFAACFRDHRQAERIEHGVEELARISHHAGTLLAVCRKGGASAPPKPRRPPSVRPAPPTACGRKLWGARNSEITVMGL